jgi:hypothetical protein
VRSGADGNGRLTKRIGEVHQLVERDVVLADVAAVGVEIKAVAGPAGHAHVHHRLRLVPLHELA